MAEKRTNLAIQLRTNNVLELAGFRMRLIVANRKRVRQQALGQPMPPHDVLRAAIAGIGQTHFGRADFNQRRSFQAPQHVCRIGRAERAHMLHLRDSSLFLANPNLLEQMIHALLVLGRGHGGFRQAPVDQFDAPLGQPANFGRMRHHQDRVPRGMQLAQQPKHDVFVGLVKIAGRLVGKN